MNHHVVIKHFAILNKYNTWCLNTSITIDVQQGAKKEKKSFIVSITSFFNNVIICKKMNLFKNKSLNTCCYSLQKTTTHRVPLKTFGQGSLCFINVIEFFFLINDNWPMKYSLTQSIKPWNTISFFPSLKLTELLQHSTYRCFMENLIPLH